MIPIAGLKAVLGAVQKSHTAYPDVLGLASVLKLACIGRDRAPILDFNLIRLEKTPVLLGLTDTCICDHFLQTLHPVFTTVRAVAYGVQEREISRDKLLEIVVHARDERRQTGRRCIKG